MMSDLPDDQPASDDIERAEHQAPAPETFKQLFDLLALIGNATAAETRLISLRQKHSAIRSAQKKLDAERRAFDEYRAEETAKLEREKKSAASVWAMVRSREAAVEAREEQAREEHREAESGSRVPVNYHRPDDDFVPM